jgi:regulator of sigma E protease
MFTNYISMFSFLLSLAGIGFLITIHELGHFLFCKLFKIPAPKFAIGIGPKLFQKKIGETDFSIGIIPIAGYVQIGDEKQSESEVGILFKKPFFNGTMVLLGGIIFNILFAYIAIISTALLSDKLNNNNYIKMFLPHTIVKTIEIKDDKIKDIDIQIGDQFLTCNDKKMCSKFDLINTILNEPNKNIVIEILRGNEKKIITIEKETIPTKCILNFGSEKELSIFDRFQLGITTTNNIIAATFYGILSIFKNINKISGVLGILKVGSGAAKDGIIDLIIFLTLVSINLAIANLIPLPILDGGQFVMLSMYKIFGKGMSDKVYSILMYGSFGLMGLLMLYSTYNDILRFFIH